MKLFRSSPRRAEFLRWFSIGSTAAVYLLASIAVLYVAAHNFHAFSIAFVWVMAVFIVIWMVLS